MDLSAYFKSIIDSDTAPVVVCDTAHIIIYMNPAAAAAYEKRGGSNLTGKSIMDCHNSDSCEKINQVVQWFSESPENNRVFTFHNDRQNKDVYMIALRDDHGRLIGYYEKHEYRNCEDISHLYDLKQKHGTE